MLPILLKLLTTKREENTADGDAAGGAGTAGGDASQQQQTGGEKTGEQKTGDQQQAGGQGTQQSKEGDGQTGATQVPEKYDLKLPENAALKADTIERAAAYAKTQGLSNEHAQKVLDFVHAEVQTALASQKTANEEAFNQRSDQWVKEAKEDETIGGEKGAEFNANIQIAKRAVQHYFGDKIKDVLDQTGWGNHPEIIRGFLKLGKQMEADGVVLGNKGGSTEKDAATVLYGETTQQ